MNTQNFKPGDIFYATSEGVIERGDLFWKLKVSRVTFIGSPWAIYDTDARGGVWMPESAFRTELEAVERARAIICELSERQHKLHRKRMTHLNHLKVKANKILYPEG